MKSLLPFLLFHVLSVVVCSQTYLHEDFNAGMMPPPGWTVDNYESSWSVINSQKAGGISPEGKFSFSWNSSVSRLFTDPIDLTGVDTINLSFRHKLEIYNSGISVGAATRSAGGSWNSVWEINPNSSAGPEEIIIEIANDDVGQTSFQFCLYIQGPFHNISGWYLDDIFLYKPLSLDCMLTSINSPSFSTSPIEISGTIKNLGLSQVQTLEIQWQIGNGTIYSSAFNNLDLDLSDQYDFECDDYLNAQIGNHNLKVWINNVNGVPDDFTGNDTLTKEITVVSHTVDLVPCFEEFTSSTCEPCAFFHEQFDPWCEDHFDDITLIKYQMNWPGNGDPYYTEEGGSRKNYYGVSWVPWLNVNGFFVDNLMPEIQAVFDEAILQPGLVSLISSHSFNGTSISIDAAALAFTGLSNLKMHMIVIEKMTTGNIGTNGETEFNHVMMKMVPDTNGINIDLADRQPVTVSETADLAGTNIEEWDDLMVVILVQDYSGKQIYQSEYSVENGSFNNECRLSEININGAPLQDFDPDVFDYDYLVPPGTTEVQLTEAVTMDAGAMAIVVSSPEIPGPTTIDVFAENLISHQTYTVNFDFLDSVNETDFDEKVRIFPNPVRDFLHVEGVTRMNVEIFDLSGQLIFSGISASPTTLNLQHLPEGFYHIRLTGERGGVTSRNLSIYR